MTDTQTWRDNREGRVSLGPRFTTSLHEWAEREAGRLLAPLEYTWAHTQGVAATARALSTVLAPAEREVAVAAAWLHDVGCAPGIIATAFHPLGGACHVASFGHPRIASLVAHHTGARYEAEWWGLGAELAEFPREDSEVADLVTYADLTTSPSGLPVNPGHRLAMAAWCYGPDHVVTRSLAEARPELLAAVSRVEARLTEPVMQALRAGMAVAATVA